MTTATAAAPKILVDRFEVVRELGRGSMGVVYECRVRDTRRPVAVKVVSLKGRSASVRVRAQREQHALARLKSPHIVQLYELVDAGEELHLVYELVDGSSLDRIGRVSIADAVSVALGVAAALKEAHSAGFIHRDLKPSNVIVPRDAEGELDYTAAKLLDFGVAGALTKRDNHGVGTTMLGEIFGSPLYMSPEQVRGDPQSAATDAYGVGGLLFQLVYGRTVFESASFTQLLMEIVGTEVSFPAEPEVPEPLRALIARCLAKDPKQRFQHGGELLEALSDVARGTISGFAPVAPAAQKFGPAPVARVAPAPVADDRSVKSYGAAAPVAGTRSAAAAAVAAVGQASVPELTAKSHSSTRWIIAAAVSGALIAAMLTSAWFLLSTSVAVPDHAIHGKSVLTSASASRVPVVVWLVVGIAASWLAAYFVHRAIEKRRVPLAGSVAAVLGRANAVEDLSKSLAVDVAQLLEVCRSLDQHMLAKTLALMVGEYDKARESEDRQAALMKAVELMEKLHEKLAPWYVKRQAVLAWGVGILGSVLSAAKTLSEVLELLHKH